MVANATVITIMMNDTKEPRLRGARLTTQAHEERFVKRMIITT